MDVVDIAEIEGRVYPAGRRSKNLVGGLSALKAGGFSMGLVVVEPNGGQVPWHNHEQEEAYFVLEGSAEICIGEERGMIHSGQTVFIPSGVFHQVTNLGEAPMRFLYVYSPAGDVAH